MRSLTCLQRPSALQASSFKTSALSMVFARKALGWFPAGRDAVSLKRKKGSRCSNHCANLEQRNRCNDAASIDTITTKLNIL
ncbi:hypothetical protein FA95DRAFT_1424199 [Auriscalpium vulgare]|uniref:Uncharacterized protein n=1 Tax=Auriscalpium vulgare TaxID=40419 RepID=A0ACB8RQV1_9AGAM|nr:hypothetical protein FA95DRAFT_1424199 [Auriscalpium vulgare]